jgi:hypothetical protein
MTDHAYIPYLVEYRSVPGMYEQYSGTMVVYAIDEDAAIGKVFGSLKRNAFPDRTFDMWHFECEEHI